MQGQIQDFQIGLEGGGGGGKNPVCACSAHSEHLQSMKSLIQNWRLVPSKLGLGSMGNACYSKIKSRLQLKLIMAGVQL